MSLSSSAARLTSRSILRAVGAGDPQRRGDVLVDRHRRIVDELLVDHGDVALLHRHAGDVLAVEPDRAGGRRVEAGHQPHQAGLARQRRAEQHVERAVLKRQRHVADMIRAADRLRHVPQFQHSASSQASVGVAYSAAALCDFALMPFHEFIERRRLLAAEASGRAWSAATARPRRSPPIRARSDSGLPPRRDRRRSAGQDRPPTWRGQAARCASRAVEPDQPAREPQIEKRVAPFSSADLARRSRSRRNRRRAATALAVHGLPFAAEEILDLLQHGFGKPAIGRDLAAEDVDDRRLPSCAVGLQHIVARRFLRLRGAVVVERAHAGIGPDDVLAAAPARRNTRSPRRRDSRSRRR